MAVKSHFAKLGAVLALFIASSSAIADVKGGVDAWTRGEYEAAVKQWREPALKGDADAQFNMGQAYKMGRGVKTDLAIALDWYRKAAAQGHLQAADSYGHLLHYQGKVKESLPYLQTSADRGEPRAQYLLATELFNGVHIEKDWVRAYALMTRASSAGMAPASRSLAQMDNYIPLEQRQRATVLAAELEQHTARARTAQVTGFPINTKPPVKTGAAVPVPPSKTPPSKTPPETAPGFPADLPVAGEKAAAPPKPTPAKPVPAKAEAQAKPVPAKVEAPAKPALAKPTMVAKDGPWRVQLGAFGNEGNAQKLWTSLEAKLPELAKLQPYLRASGKLTKLQAGPFASRNSADMLCGKIKATGQACIPVPR